MGLRYLLSRIMHDLIVRAPKNLVEPGLRGVRLQDIFRRVRADAVNHSVHVDDHAVLASLDRTASEFSPFVHVLLRCAPRPPIPRFHSRSG